MYVEKKKLSHACKEMFDLGWVEDVTTKELMIFHGVILNMARHVKSSIKDFFFQTVA
jgi:hypothetical protein